MSDQVEYAIEIKGNWSNALVWYYIAHTAETTESSSALSRAATWHTAKGAQRTCDEINKKLHNQTAKVIEIPCQF